MKKSGLASLLFFQNLTLISVFGIFTLALSYLTTFRALQHQQEHSLQSEFFEIRSVSDNFSDVLAVIRAETSSQQVNNPRYRIFNKDGSPVFSSKNIQDHADDSQLIASMRSRLSDQSLFVLRHQPGENHDYIHVVGILQDGKVIAISESTDDLLAILKTAFANLALNSAFMVMFLVLLSWYLSRRALKGINSVIRSAKSIAHLTPKAKEEGILAYQVQESNELAAAFNELLAAIQRSIAEVFSITDDMSHDFKTSLNRIRCQAEFLISSEKSATDVRDGLIQILEECDSLTSLINTVLDISRYSTGEPPADIVPVDHRKSLEDMFGLYEASFEDMDISLELSLEHGIIVTSPRMLNIIFSNLLDNILKYTTRPGLCRIKCVTVVGGFTWTIENSSPIYRDEDYARIFQRFVRLDPARNNSQGHGLGLNMCAAIVSRLGGQIFASSGTLGFTLSLYLPEVIPGHKPQHITPR